MEKENNPTFDRLPFAVEQLNQKFDYLLQLFKEGEPGQKQQAELLNVPEAAKFLNLAIPTVYSMVSRGELPFFKPKGTKRLYFRKSLLIDWIQSGRKLTNAERREQAAKHLKTPKRKEG